MQSWASEELKYAALPDKRLNQRRINIVENLAQQPNASIPANLQQAIILIARLRGFLACRRDDFPGVKTLWKKLQRLHDIASTWKLLHPPQNPNL